MVNSFLTIIKYSLPTVDLQFECVWRNNAFSIIQNYQLDMTNYNNNSDNNNHKEGENDT